MAFVISLAMLLSPTPSFDSPFHPHTFSRIHPTFLLLSTSTHVPPSANVAKSDEPHTTLLVDGVLSVDLSGAVHNIRYETISQSTCA